MKKSLLITVFTVLTLSLPVFSADLADSDAALIEQALDLSGVKEQIGLISDSMESELASYKQAVNPEAHELFGKIVKEAFNEAAFYSRVLESFKAEFDRKKMETLISLLKSPLSIKMARLEVEASDPAKEQEIRDFTLRFPFNPVTQERSGLAQKINEITDQVDTSLKIQVSIFQSITKAVNPLVQEYQRMTQKGLDEIAETMEDRLKPMLESQILISTLYTYRSATDQELKDYIEILKKEESRWFNKNLANAFIKALVQAASDMGEGIKGSADELRFFQNKQIPR
ncbi:MAG: hypothetical protein ABH872_01895 [Candidatus Omnitrophota bacterium]